MLPYKHFHSESKPLLSHDQPYNKIRVQYHVLPFGHKFPNCLDLFVHETSTLLIANANHVTQLSVRILSSEDPLLLNTSYKLKIHVLQSTKTFLKWN
jgi:hypothetical protein